MQPQTLQFSCKPLDLVSSIPQCVCIPSLIHNFCQTKCSISAFQPVSHLQSVYHFIFVLKWKWSRNLLCFLPMSTSVCLVSSGCLYRCQVHVIKSPYLLICIQDFLACIITHVCSSSFKKTCRMKPCYILCKQKSCPDSSPSALVHKYSTDRELTKVMAFEKGTYKPLGQT